MTEEKENHPHHLPARFENTVYLSAMEAHIPHTAIFAFFSFGFLSLLCIVSFSTRGAFMGNFIYGLQSNTFGV